MTFDFSNVIFTVLIFSGPILTIAGVIMRIYSPKKINWLYGYRTKRSMASQEAWDLAQNYSARLLIVGGLALTIIGSISTILSQISVGLGLGISLVALLVTALVIVWLTERQLKKRTITKTLK